MSELGKKVVLIDLDSGEQIYAAPISPLIINAIVRQSEVEYPYPDDAPYRLPLENAAIPGDTLPASENPSYRALMKSVEVERAKYQNISVVLASVNDAPLGKDTLIAKYADDVETMRAIVPLPENAWHATLYLLIASRDDQMLVVNAATSSLPLTSEEVRDGMRIFRPQVQGSGNRVVSGKKSAPRIEEEHPV